MFDNMDSGGGVVSKYYTVSWNMKITDQVGDVVDDVPEVVTVW